MIVVAGGSGLLGRLVVEDLRARCETVRAVVRDERRARDVLGPDVEIVAADVRDRRAVGEALQGAAVVVSALHGFLGGRGAGPAEVDVQGNRHLVDAARTVGADVVLVSVLGASASTPVELFRAKFVAETELQGSGVPWTIVRASAFLETWLTILAQTAGKSHRSMVFGRGERLIPFVSVVDVAAVVAEATIQPESRAQVLEVSGPDVTMNQLARALQAHEGWSGGARHLPRAVLRMLSLLARPVSPAFARQNSTALAMDTVPLPGRVTPVSPLGTARRSVADVLATATSWQAGA
jgi:uncharacterized protein YbjT (DUF2867 family)